MSTPSDDDSPSAVISSSTYPALEPPGEFKSQIPEHLMVDTTPTDRYIMEQISIMRQLGDWSVKAHLSQDRQLRYTNGKVKRHEGELAQLKDDKKSVITGWRAIAALGGILSGIISFLILLYQTLNGSGH